MPHTSAAASGRLPELLENEDTRRALIEQLRRTASEAAPAIEAVSPSSATLPLRLAGLTQSVAERSPGGVVTAGGVTGGVEKLTIRSLGIRDLSGVYHLIPFSSVNMVSNFNRDFGYHVGEYGVAYREDTDAVIEHLKAAFEELRADPAHSPNILGDLEVHGITALADSSVNIRVRIKTLPGKQAPTGRAYNRLVKRHFDAAGIEIPFPHMTVYFGEDKQGKAPAANLRLIDATPGKEG